MRFQLVGASIVAVLIPVAVRVMFNPALLYTPNINNSIIAALFAIVLGFFTWRRISSFASVEATQNIIWSFLTFFILVMTFLFFFRIEYSRFVFFSAMGLTLIWFVAINLWIRSKYKVKLGIIEGGGLQTLPPNPDIVFQKLVEPVSDFSNLNGVVIDLRHDHSPNWTLFITDLTLAGIPVFHYRQIEEEITGQVSIEHLYENRFGSLLPNLLYLRLKNRLEQTLALLSLPIIIPIGLFAALAILVVDGRPIIFAQKRMGFRGKPFIAYKFRSMKNSDANQRSAHDAMTKTNDPRITKLGKILRKYRIDEIPQVFNILRGEMGWIGPRPEAIQLSEMYQKELPFYRYRHAVRPGITGWAQVNQGHVTSVADIDEKLKYDFYYIEKISVWLDLLIVLKTIRIVFFGIGAK